MAISAISPIQSSLAAGGVVMPLPSSGAAGVATGGGGFGDALAGVINRLGQTERGTTDLVARAAAGDDVDMHDIMIATQTESLTFQMALQIRNKLVEAYQEVTRINM